MAQFGQCTHEPAHAPAVTLEIVWTWLVLSLNPAISKWPAPVDVTVTAHVVPEQAVLSLTCVNVHVAHAGLQRSARQRISR
jgi:hypothetical protein